MLLKSLHTGLEKIRSLGSNQINRLPIVILMPHSACNCRCVMCDIWKGNKNLKQLELNDIQSLLNSLHLLGTKEVLMSGGEALLHTDFFRFCELLKQAGFRITLLTTGLTLSRHAEKITELIDELIISLDGTEKTHDSIRQIPGAFQKIKKGIRNIKSLRTDLPVRSRTVIHRLNFFEWSEIIDSAKQMEIDQVSFLPADISSTAFNREMPWGVERQSEIALSEEELPVLQNVIDDLIQKHQEDFQSNFIAESAEKIRKIQIYYEALLGLSDFPYKKCNAPWVSAVVEPDGNVRPCFFHQSIGNIRKDNLNAILNGSRGKQFRKELDMKKNDTCRRCVCSLYLSSSDNRFS